MKLIITKITAVVLLAGFIFFMMYEKEPVYLEKQELMDKMIASVDLNGSVEGNNLRFKRSYSLNSEDFDYVIYYEPESNMDVTELLIVKLKEEGQGDAVLSAIEKRLETQKKNFDGYGTDQTEILQKSHIYSVGNYVCFFVSKNSDAFLESFKKAVEV